MPDSPRLDQLRRQFRDNPRRFFAPLASELRRAGLLEEAVALGRAHLPQFPAHLSGTIVFGQALYDLGELTEARAVFEEALRADPENLVALRVLGDIAKRRGDPAAARRWYERVLDADPRNDEIASQLQDLTPPSTEPRPFRPPALVAVPVPANAAAAAEAARRDRAPAPSDLQDDDPFAFPASVDSPGGAPLRDVPEGDWGAVPPSLPSTDEAASGFGEEATAAEFEEGLMAPMAWPDTADLVARKLTPHALPAFPMPADDETIAAFGRERHDPPAPPRRQDDSDAFLDAGAELVAPLPVVEVPGAPEPTMWAAGAAEPGAVDEVDAAVDLVFGVTAAPLGAEVPSATEAWQTVPPMDAGTPAGLVPTAGEGSGAPGDDDDPPPVAAESATAFRTETMAELLLAQGFVAQALAVYETLAAERPDDAALARRLATLREVPGRVQGHVVPPTVTAPEPVAPAAGGTTARQALAQLLDAGPTMRSVRGARGGDAALPPGPMASPHPIFDGVGRAVDERMAMGWRDAMIQPARGGGAPDTDSVGQLWSIPDAVDEGLALEDVFAVGTPPAVPALPDRPVPWGGR
jgi:tetratricopeptide (TPR) repeat protein